MTHTREGDVTTGEGRRDRSPATPTASRKSRKWVCPAASKRKQPGPRHLRPVTAARASRPAGWEGRRGAVLKHGVVGVCRSSPGGPAQALLTVTLASTQHPGRRGGRVSGPSSWSLTGSAPGQLSHTSGPRSPSVWGLGLPLAGAFREACLRKACSEETLCQRRDSEVPPLTHTSGH